MKSVKSTCSDLLNLIVDEVSPVLDDNPEVIANEAANSDSNSVCDDNHDDCIWFDCVPRLLVNFFDVLAILFKLNLVLLLSLIQDFVNENDCDNADNNVDHNVEDEHELEALADLESVHELVLLEPFEDPEAGVEQWQHEQERYEREVVLLSYIRSNWNKIQNNLEYAEEEECFDTALDWEAATAVRSLWHFYLLYLNYNPELLL